MLYFVVLGQGTVFKNMFEINGLESVTVVFTVVFM